MNVFCENRIRAKITNYNESCIRFFAFVIGIFLLRTYDLYSVHRDKNTKKVATKLAKDLGEYGGISHIPSV